MRISALALISIAALSGASCYHGSKPSEIGKAAPDFTIQDSDHSVSLSQYRGKIVVLNFWATWCPPCIEEMPSLVALQKRMQAQGKDVVVLAVSLDDDANDYHKFLKEYGVDFVTVREAGEKTDKGVLAPVSEQYGTIQVPETYIIDRNGMIRRKFIGAVDWGQQEIIEYLSRL